MRSSRWKKERYRRKAVRRLSVSTSSPCRHCAVALLVLVCAAYEIVLAVQ
ncbi:hypothetical protein [Streptomyces sp. NPDC051909]